MNIYIIIAIVVFLIIIGAAGRKSIFNFIKGKANKVVKYLEKDIDTLKGAVLSARKDMERLAMLAAKLTTSINNIRDLIYKNQDRASDLRKEAKELKESGQNEKAKSKLSLAINAESRVLSLKNRMDNAQEMHDIYVSKIEQMKDGINNAEIEISDLESRLELNKIDSQMNYRSNISRLSELINNLSTHVNEKEEAAHLLKEEDDTQTQVNNAELEEEFNKL